MFTTDVHIWRHKKWRHHFDNRPFQKSMLCLRNYIWRNVFWEISISCDVICVSYSTLFIIYWMTHVMCFVTYYEILPICYSSNRDWILLENHFYYSSDVWSDQITDITHGVKHLTELFAVIEYSNIEMSHVTNSIQKKKKDTIIYVAVNKKYKQIKLSYFKR